MPIQPYSPLADASRRSATDHDLVCLFREVVSAREADRLARDTRRPTGTPHSASTRLAASLSAYTRALESHQLPVPPAIRDELRLRRGLSS